MKKKILIVDDESSVLQILSSHVTKLGCTALTATNGEEAIRIIQKDAPDLVLLDILMPVKDGFQVLEEVKIKQKSSIPIIVLTNYDDSKDVEKAKSLGSTDYIVKSNMTLAEIMSKIKNILG